MKNLILFVLTLVLALATSCNKLADPSDCDCNKNDSIDIKSDLILHYTFDSLNANDISGFNNHGKVFNESYTVPGIKGNSIRLIGKGISTDEGGHVLLPMLDFNNYKSFSINIWVYEENWTYEGGSAIVCWGDEFEGMLGIYKHWGRPRLDLERKIKFSVGAIWDGDESFNPRTFIPTYQVDLAGINDLNKWVFYSLVYENGEMFCYRNSQLLGRMKQKVMVNGNVAGINRHWWDFRTKTCSRFIGNIDEFRVYKRALTQKEVLALYKEKNGI